MYIYFEEIAINNYPIIWEWDEKSTFKCLFKLNGTKDIPDIEEIKSVLNDVKEPIAITSTEDNLMFTSIDNQFLNRYPYIYIKPPLKTSQKILDLTLVHGFYAPKKEDAEISIVINKPANPPFLFRELTKHIDIQVLYKIIESSNEHSQAWEIILSETQLFNRKHSFNKHKIAQVKLQIIKELQELFESSLSTVLLNNMPEDDTELSLLVSFVKEKIINPIMFIVSNISDTELNDEEFITMKLAPLSLLIKSDLDFDFDKIFTGTAWANNYAFDHLLEKIRQQTKPYKKAMEEKIEIFSSLLLELRSLDTNVDEQRNLKNLALRNKTIQSKGKNKSLFNAQINTEIDGFSSLFGQFKAYLIQHLPKIEKAQIPILEQLINDAIQKINDVATEKAKKFPIAFNSVSENNNDIYLYADFKNILADFLKQKAPVIALITKIKKSSKTFDKNSGTDLSKFSSFIEASLVQAFTQALNANIEELTSNNINSPSF